MMMLAFSSAWVAACFALLPTVVAFDISVKANGGNATNGHQYGFLHEVGS